MGTGEFHGDNETKHSQARPYQRPASEEDRAARHEDRSQAGHEDGEARHFRGEAVDGYPYRRQAVRHEARTVEAGVGQPFLEQQHEPAGEP